MDLKNWFLSIASVLSIDARLFKLVLDKLRLTVLARLWGATSQECCCESSSSEQDSEDSGLDLASGPDSASGPDLASGLDSDSDSDSLVESIIKAAMSTRSVGQVTGPGDDST